MNLEIIDWLSSAYRLTSASYCVRFSGFRLDSTAHFLYRLLKFAQGLSQLFCVYVFGDVTSRRLTSFGVIVKFVLKREIKISFCIFTILTKIILAYTLV
ncbi:hypothetical protein LEP1GSC128_1575 [Leptospira borgpetersenii str. 200801926]|uniref:Uncharacterized protein n=1 Tax=Leptospira borgpetersenii str. 200801926 TaxID=1193009 RepID=A0ABN0I0U5_LEPBO|nr:hypothetical protein LEP1GSC128_1575 [Leptospira borgpetersenii str. 200801926]